MVRPYPYFSLAILLAGCTTPSEAAPDKLAALFADNLTVVDLTHAVSAEAPYWLGPDRSPFVHDTLSAHEHGAPPSSGSAASPQAGDIDTRAILLDPTHAAWSENAPDTFRARFETTRGAFVVEVVRAWAPIGTDRFYNLIRHGYYDDVRFHRAVPDFITQWGVSGDPEVSAVWYERGMADDTVVASNARGTMAFAFTEPGTRSTQAYISMVDNSRLDAQGFAPFGRVVEGMDSVVDSIYSGHGENSGGGVRRGDQSRIVAEGNAYLDAEFPELDRLLRVTIERR